MVANYYLRTDAAKQVVAKQKKNPKTKDPKKLNDVPITMIASLRVVVVTTKKRPTLVLVAVVAWQLPINDDVFGRHPRAMMMPSQLLVKQ